MGLGKRMLGSFIDALHPAYITSYTRNPAMLMCIAHYALDGQAYPVNIPEELIDLASEMPHANVDDDNIGYHIGRYGDTGLYGGFDPADRLYANGQIFKERFPGLQDIGNALVVVAKMPESSAL